MNDQGVNNSDSEPRPSDQTLLRRIQGGEEDAATALYIRYAQRLQRLATLQSSSELATRLDPEDVVQSVFRTFFRRAAAGEYEIPEGEELWKLLLVIALNKIRALGKFHRAAKRNVRATEHPSQLESVGGAGKSENQMALQALRMTIEEVLAELPESHRQIVTLRIEGYEVAEVAQRTKRSKRTVERVLQGFRRQLSELIG